MVELWGMSAKDETCLAIGEFAISWSQFEATYCNRYFASPNKITVIAPDIDPEIILSTINIKKSILEINNETFPVIKRLNIRNNEYNYEPYINSFLNNKDFSNDDIIACIYIGNRIRNNLLHGEKDLVNLDLQIDIFKALTKFFLLIVELSPMIEYTKIEKSTRKTSDGRK